MKQWVVRNLNRGLIMASLLIVALTLLQQRTPAADAQALSCTSGYNINETLPNGSVWTMCWTDSTYDGVTLWSVYYKAPGAASSVKVLHEARLAQLFVPYYDNGARFYDVTDYGLGGSNRVNLTASECPGGTLLANNGVNTLCKIKVTTADYAYKSGAGYKMAGILSLTSSSKIGQYVYVQRWTFHDDGTIEPAVGATGRLQRCSSSTTYGWPLGAASNCPNSNGVAHTHNYYWYMDFDLRDSSNDTLSVIESPNNETSNTRTISQGITGTETSARFNQAAGRTWRIRDSVATNTDGHALSYELGADSSHTFYGPEAFTKNDIYVTNRSYNCERYAAHNQLRMGTCSTDDVSGFVNGQALSDLVVWYRSSFHHIPRDEDDYNMSTHWNHFHMTPRDMNATSLR